MSAVTSTNALAKDSTLQDVADAISTMGATSVGNLSALTTTDKTSLVGAVNEVKSGLTNYLFVTRARVTTPSIAANNETHISRSDVISGVYNQIPSGYNIVAITIEGANPTTTWDCVPLMFYSYGSSDWIVRNIGTGADIIGVEFTVFAVKS